MAFLVLGCCVFLDVHLNTDGKMTMYGLPFVTAMIGIKQVIQGREN